MFGSERRKKIIAVDFDGCLCKNAWPEIGQENKEVIAALKKEVILGARIILWTCRSGRKLEEAVLWCEERGILFDEINANLKESIRAAGGDTRKIFADEYWDDRAVNVREML